MRYVHLTASYFLKFTLTIFPVKFLVTESGFTNSSFPACFTTFKFQVLRYESLKARNVRKAAFAVSVKQSTVRRNVYYCSHS